MFHCLVIKVLCLSVFQTACLLYHILSTVSSTFLKFFIFQNSKPQTEKEGFETSRRYKRPTPFPGEPLRPAWVLLQIALRNRFFFQKRFILYRVVFYLSRTFLTFQKFFYSLQISERVGFEPTRPCGQTVFKTASL